MDLLSAMAEQRRGGGDRQSAAADSSAPLCHTPISMAPERMRQPSLSIRSHLDASYTSTVQRQLAPSFSSCLCGDAHPLFHIRRPFRLHLPRASNDAPFDPRHHSATGIRLRTAAVQ